MKMKKGLLYCWLLLPFSVFSQDTSYLSFDAYYDQVLKYHPFAAQARLLPAMAKAELRSARGAFDPVLQANLSGKQTNEKNSYTYLEPQLKIPTLPGIDVKAGMDQSSGMSVNPEKGKYDAATGGTKDVQYQLFYAGVSVPLLRGMITDTRRNQLRQAQVLQDLNAAEQVSQINKLMLSASKSYWDWALYYRKLELMRENRILAAARKDYIVKRIMGGEEKPIDSVEAAMELYRREALVAEAELEFRNSTLELSNYLWDQEAQPVLPGAGVIPNWKGSERVTPGLDSLNKLSAYAGAQHPDVQKLQVKVQQNELEKKLAIENIKPQLNLEYYPFQTYTAGSKDEVDGLFMKNYKFGVSFYSSLYLRKERGKLELTQFKVRQSEYQLMQGRREVQNNVLEAYNELQTFDRLIEIQEQMVLNARSMRVAEETRFRGGESSLFLVNQRERNLLEAELKLAELKAKYAKARYQLQWASGTRLF